MIVVGIDGSEQSAEALQWALDEAKLRETDVRAVFAWMRPGIPGYYAEALQDPGPYQEGAEKTLENLLAQTAPDTDGVKVKRHVEQGSPADVLVRAADGADLLVVGSRGQGGFASLLLGSVSQQCAQHATCPVVIVRRPAA